MTNKSKTIVLSEAEQECYREVLNLYSCVCKTYNFDLQWDTTTASFVARQLADMKKDN